MSCWLYLVVLGLCWVSPFVTCQSREQCQVYYGGLVFPEGSRRSLEHGMHWSKTQSKSQLASDRYVCLEACLVDKHIIHFQCCSWIMNRHY
jgi:hypothetical protein